MAASSGEGTERKRRRNIERSRWTRKETLLLISCWKELRYLFKTFGQRKAFYKQISIKMNESGYLRSSEQCQAKITRLKYIYQNLRMQSDSEWPFYEMLDSILGDCELSEEEYFDTSSVCPALYVQAELEMSPSGEDEVLSDESVKLLNNVVGCELEIRSVSPVNDSYPTKYKGSKVELWSLKETFNLIEMWKKLNMPVKKESYEDVANLLAESGYYRTAEQCQRKVSNLKAQYRKYHKLKCDDQIHKIEWPYYDILHDILKLEYPVLKPARTQLNLKDNWSEDETITLIAAWKNFNFELERTVIKTPIYEKIADYLMEFGHRRSGEECQQKVIQLKILYRQACVNNCIDTSWLFFSAVHEIMSLSSGGDSKSKITNLDHLEESQKYHKLKCDKTDCRYVFRSTCETKAPNSEPGISQSDVTDNWMENETLALIAIWKEFNSELERSVIKTLVYEKMSKRHTEFGYRRTGVECQKKIIQLKTLYQQAYLSNDVDTTYLIFNAVQEVMNKALNKTDDESKLTPFFLNKNFLHSYASEHMPEEVSCFKENNYKHNVLETSTETKTITTKPIITPTRKILPKCPSFSNIIIVPNEPQCVGKVNATLVNTNDKIQDKIIDASVEPLLFVVPSGTSEISKTPNLMFIPQEIANINSDSTIFLLPINQTFTTNQK